MEKTKILDNIKPFNELFFINCFYNSLFSVIQFYDKSIIPFLVNYNQVYSYTKDINQMNISSKYFSAYQLQTILSNMGIKYFGKGDNNISLDKIIKSLSHNHPIIIFVDCYYMPIRREYLKCNLIHTVLLCGYDNNTETFTIIEQKSSDTLSYQMSYVKYSDLLKAYESAVNILGSNKHILYYEFDTGEELGDRFLKHNYNYKEEFESNLNMNLHYIGDGLKNLTEFTNDSKNLFRNEDVLKLNLNELLDGLNMIINSKRVELYKVKEIYGAESILTLIIAKIEQSWCSIRYKCAKYYYSSLYRKSDFLSLTNLLEEIYQNEMDFLEYFTK